MVGELNRSANDVCMYSGRHVPAPGTHTPRPYSWHLCVHPFHVPGGVPYARSCVPSYIHISRRHTQAAYCSTSRGIYTADPRVLPFSDTTRRGEYEANEEILDQPTGAFVLPPVLSRNVYSLTM